MSSFWKSWNSNFKLKLTRATPQLGHASEGKYVGDICCLHIFYRKCKKKKMFDLENEGDGVQHSQLCPFHSMANIFIYYWFDIPSTCANNSVSRFASLVLRLLLGFLAARASDRRFVIECQVCSLRTKPQVSTTLPYMITVCCNRTAHSQHFLLASVEARELNLK